MKVANKTEINEILKKKREELGYSKDVPLFDAFEKAGYARELPKDLSGINMNNILANGVDFSGRNLIGTSLELATLIESNFEGANLKNANCFGADFTKANFNKANLCKTKFVRAKLIESRLLEAVLEETDFTNVNMEGSEIGYILSAFGVKLDKANLKGVILGEISGRSSDSIRREVAAQNQPKTEKAELKDLVDAKLDVTTEDIKDSSLIISEIVLVKEQVKEIISEIKSVYTEPKKTNSKVAHKNEIDNILKEKRKTIASYEDIQLLDALEEAGYARELPIDLSGINMKSIIGNGADFSGRNLTGTSLEFASLNEANFEGANLKNANCTGANFTKANLNKANLCKTKFVHAKLIESRLLEAVLEETDFTNANMEGSEIGSISSACGVKLDNANLKGVKLGEIHGRSSDTIKRAVKAQNEHETGKADLEVKHSSWGERSTKQNNPYKGI